MRAGCVARRRIGARRRSGAGRDVSRRGAPAAAVLLATPGRRHRWDCSTASSPWWRRPPTAPRLSTSTDDVRDLAGEIEWAKIVVDQPARAYPAAVAEAGRDIPFDAAEDRRACTPATRAQGPPRRRRTLLDFDDLLLHTAAAIENDAVAQEFRDRYRVLRRRRVPGRHAPAAARARRLARRPRRPHGRRRRQPDHLLVHRRHPATICWTSPRRFPRPPWSGWSATTGPPRRWCRWPTASSPVPAAGWRAAGCTSSASAMPDRCRRSASTPTRSPRRPPSPRPIKRLIAAGTAASEIAVLYRINAQSEVYEEALTDGGHRVPGPRWRGLLQPPGDPAGAAGPATRAPSVARRTATSCRRWSAN